MNKKILICEDEKDSRDSLKNILVRRNFEIYTASNGEESILRAKEVKPDLILLDIRMPKINGLEVAKQIRNWDIKSKIIVITSFQSPELYKEAVKYNIIDYIVKPMDTNDLLKVINAALKPELPVPKP
jgi:YesN/AraC family two-component response regulator